jgi:hypothetical protein
MFLKKLLSTVCLSLYLFSICAMGEFNESDIKGTWVYEDDVQKITLKISSESQARWTVIFQGRDHSDQKGTWKLENDFLIINLEITGMSKYKVAELTDNKLFLKATDHYDSDTVFYRK